MSDPTTITTTVVSTAAADFFKNKKKKGKKVFTFNANLVDADTVTQTIHVYVCVNVDFESIYHIFIENEYRLLTSILPLRNVFLFL